MNVAPSGRPERRAAVETGGADDSEPGRGSRPGPDENPCPPVSGVNDGDDDPPAEPDDDEYVPL